MISVLGFDSDFDPCLLGRIINEKKEIGYYNLPNQDTTYVHHYLKQLNKRQDLNSIIDIVVIGIGGSSLGAKAVYHFIKPIRQLKRNLHFMDSTDPVTITNICNSINMGSTHFIVISKSGTTIETIAAYKHILAIIKSVQLSYFPFTFITDQGSLLAQHAQKVNGLIINIQQNIGGRFSLLSSSGIIPLALTGIKIDCLLKGAAKIKDSFFNQGYMQNALLKKATFYAKNSSNYNINALFSYTDSLKYFNDWYVQLWGESLGKKQENSALNVGLTPIGLTGPKDQHSFLQLLFEGTRDKSVTFIKLKTFDNHQKVPNITLEKLEALDLINQVEFSTLINMQSDALIESLKEHTRIPLDEIILQKQDEFSIGQLIYYYELLTSLVGDLLNINTYNQPGVESGKNILIKKLQQL
ncbi:glucose-6-phosphate isomerase [Candidatus Ruthia magnifica str. Cm (Calyptogena magnifica)]|uniref:Glucose-6-phosphate isomerase n=1 Tax=Ruthia magnifica subsp. Calyptogena magnifica TaxID=413404 RepID=A1AXE2_RUTMC|nr:glucose-6-phosphate isomerase [Candidatus Ruthturnera calyptogenae]ABL02599.1 glucose-6-phosphate isomerase [Candidatus Ruthia magnifica str. Cm (Calyptogena magnifica)]